MPIIKFPSGSKIVVTAPPSGDPVPGDPNRLHIVTAVFNPRRYKRRYQLYREFAARMARSGCVLYTVEAAFGRRPFEVTSSRNPLHFQFRTNDEWFMKENLLNLGFARLPKTAKYVAWIDADVQFTNPHWAAETVAQLQHHPVSQLFAYVINLGPHYQPFQLWNSFGYSLSLGRPIKVIGKDYNHWHPGFGWAYRREALEATGGLMDRVILGSADTSMAFAWIGRAMETVHGGASDAFKKYVQEWQAKAVAYLASAGGTVGYVPTSLIHFWHGQFKNRRYVERWEILIRNKFDPYKALEPDKSGLLHLVQGQTALRRDLQNYLAGRNEDSMEFDPREANIR